GRSGAPGAFSRTPQPSTADELPTVTLTSLPAPTTADGKSAPIQLASALVISSAAQPATVAGGVGGPLGPTSEPASAPAMHPTKTSSSGEAVKAAAGAAATGAAS
ncbi:MAG: cell wall hydrolase, partial [Caulobacter sp.]